MPTSRDPRVIVASDNGAFRKSVNDALVAIRWPAVDAVSGADALNKLHALAGIDAIIFDKRLPDLDVDDLDVSLRAHHPHLDVLLVDLLAEERCRSNRTIIHSRSKDLAWQLGRSELPVETSAGLDAPAPSPLAEPWAPLPGMIGSHESLAEVSRLVRLVAPRKTSVLITGETGTGKELIARAVHSLSPRVMAPFVAVNCAAIPETLLESELFGYARGAFTGALQAKAGRIEAANGGTLFLDEIGEMPPLLQTKLLRFLQENEIQRLGSNETMNVDVRIVAATHVDLSASDGEKPFRPDLYYRLAVFPVALSPLREREGDVLLLAKRILSDMCVKDGVGPKAFTREACDALRAYAWPGNVRQLQHVIERAFILAEDENVLTLSHLSIVDSQKALTIA